MTTTYAAILLRQLLLTSCVTVPGPPKVQRKPAESNSFCLSRCFSISLVKPTCRQTPSMNNLRITERYLSSSYGSSLSSHSSASNALTTRWSSRAASASMAKRSAFSGVKKANVSRHAFPSVKVLPLISGKAVRTPRTASHVSTSLASTLDSELYLCGANAKSRIFLLMGTSSSVFFRKLPYKSLTASLLLISLAMDCGFSTKCPTTSFRTASADQGRDNIL